MKIFVRHVVLAVILAVPVCSAVAQDTPRYSPQRPTVSPYLNLLRNNTGPLPNYYSLVRPQLDQRSFDNRISSVTRSQGIAVQRLSSLSASRQSDVTGSGSGFNNYSHFYRMPARMSARR
ncbi:MAG: hypothetical protein RIK87_13610 [Fuerstiella sp.]